MKLPLNDIIKFSLGLRAANVNTLTHRVSAITERTVLRRTATPSEWQLTAFVLDSEKTVIVSMDTNYSADKAQGHVRSTYRIYVGPRELIYQVMLDFPVDWMPVDDLRSPSEYLDGLYYDYQVIDDEPAALPAVSDNEMADLSTALKNQLLSH